MLKISSKYLAWVVHKREKCTWPVKRPRMLQGDKNWDAPGVKKHSPLKSAYNSWKVREKIRGKFGEKFGENSGGKFREKIPGKIRGKFRGKIREIFFFQYGVFPLATLFSIILNYFRKIRQIWVEFLPKGGLSQAGGLSPIAPSDHVPKNSLSRYASHFVTRTLPPRYSPFSPRN